MKKRTHQGKTFNKEAGTSYTEFFAFNRTETNDIEAVRDSDDCSRLLQALNSSNPKDGRFSLYWENGNIRYEWYFKDGKQDGISLSFWPDGSLKNITNYKNGICHGQLKGWYEDGDPFVACNRQVSGIRYWENGKRHGMWTDYYKSGMKWCEKIYNNGSLISAQYWNEDGSTGNVSCHKGGELKQFRKINKNWTGEYRLTYANIVADKFIERDK